MTVRDNVNDLHEGRDRRRGIDGRAQDSVARKEDHDARAKDDHARLGCKPWLGKPPAAAHNLDNEREA
jgi:hypothetical protein